MSDPATSARLALVPDPLHALVVDVLTELRPAAQDHGREASAVMEAARIAGLFRSDRAARAA